MGAGDAKLWLALTWALPLSIHQFLMPVFFGSLFITSLVQVGWRVWRKTPLAGISAPAAWRTIPFILTLWIVSHAC
jgi:hypothetical protein